MTCVSACVDVCCRVSTYVPVQVRYPGHLPVLQPPASGCFSGKTYCAIFGANQSTLEVGDAAQTPLLTRSCMQSRFLTFYKLTCAVHYMSRRRLSALPQRRLLCCSKRPPTSPATHSLLPVAVSEAAHQGPGLDGHLQPHPRGVRQPDHLVQGGPREGGFVGGGGGVVNTSPNKPKTNENERSTGRGVSCKR